MCRRLTRSTLFPYTTLFRSDLHVPVLGQVQPSLPVAVGGDGHEHASGAEHARALRDRKSTRLNSSHLVNSYAVFCLKKKRIQHEHAHNPLEITAHDTARRGT